MVFEVSACEARNRTMVVKAHFDRHRLVQRAHKELPLVLCWSLSKSLNTPILPKQFSKGIDINVSRKPGPPSDPGTKQCEPKQFYCWDSTCFSHRRHSFTEPPNRSCGGEHRVKCSQHSTSLGADSNFTIIITIPCTDELPHLHCQMRRAGQLRHQDHLILQPHHPTLLLPLARVNTMPLPHRPERLQQRLKLRHPCLRHSLTQTSHSGLNGGPSGSAYLPSAGHLKNG